MYGNKLTSQDLRQTTSRTTNSAVTYHALTHWKKPQRTPLTALPDPQSSAILSFLKPEIKLHRRRFPWNPLHRSNTPRPLHNPCPHLPLPHLLLQLREHHPCLHPHLTLLHLSRRRTRAPLTILCPREMEGEKRRMAVRKEASNEVPPNIKMSDESGSQNNHSFGGQINSAKISLFLFLHFCC